MNKALLDTGLYSEVLKGIDANVARNAASYRGLHGRFSVSLVTVMEVVYGYPRVKGEARLKVFLSAVVKEEVLPLGLRDAELAGRIAADLDRTGRTIGQIDPMIAATALNRGLELVTGNTAHYQRVQQLGHPLVLVNWR